MANHYTQFSFTINGLTDAEASWAAHLLGNEDRLLSLVEDDHVGFDAELQEDRRSLWVHVDESGEPVHAAALVQGFLIRFRPTESFGFEWADGCSKPVTDAFGGGAVFVTATELRWCSTADWLAKQLSADAGPLPRPGGAVGERPRVRIRRQHAVDVTDCIDAPLPEDIPPQRAKEWAIAHYDELFAAAHANRGPDGEPVDASGPRVEFENEPVGELEGQDDIWMVEVLGERSEP